MCTNSRFDEHSRMCYNIITVKDFNSHAHVERDMRQQTKQKNKNISTHTLTWSVTLNFVENIQLVKFQLTRSRGA